MMRAPTQRRRVFLTSIVLAFALLLTLGAARSALAAPRPQEGDDATLRVINESEETICYVLISPVTADSWADDWLGEDETIPPSESASFNLSSGDYDILLANCEGDQLLDQRNNTVSGQYDLRFTGPDLCESLNQEGMAFYRQAQYQDAIQKFQDAMTCYREAGCFQLTKTDNSGDSAPLILGNPATGDYDAAALATERDELGNLRFAEQEAEAIAALYETDALIREAATESVVREQAGASRIPHMAAHGVYNPVAPLQSLIALAPDDDAHDNRASDGWLTTAEVYGLDLANADLVVLSACQSHLGDLTAGDQLVGLTRAFFFASTPTVVASLWSVDDRATGLLMERFYTHLQEGTARRRRCAMRKSRCGMSIPIHIIGQPLCFRGMRACLVLAQRRHRLHPARMTPAVASVPTRRCRWPWLSSLGHWSPCILLLAPSRC
jgi:hypothetical protein